MARFDDLELEEIKRRTDLAALIRSRGVVLTGGEAGNLVGRCPFHDDETPSLVVTPAKGLWRCMSPACGATGNAIQFIMKKDGLSFRHAVELLRAPSAAAFTAQPKRARVLASPVALDADDQTLLRQVVDYYAERLRDPQAGAAARAYLEKRGLCSAEAIAAHGIGFADRTLGLRLPERTRKAGAEIRERLEKLGLYRESGREHFNGCVVFPLFDQDGAILGLYGRKIVENQTAGLAKHLYLPGPHRGLWNPAALKSREVILCEAVLDALSFWANGHRNVTTAYGVEGFSDEMLDAFVAAKVARVFLAFDRDEAGEIGAAKVGARLMARGIECRRVLFPHGQDANDYARKTSPANKALGVLLNAAAWMGKGQGVVSADAAATTLRKNGCSDPLLAPAPSSLAALVAKEVAMPTRAPEVNAAPSTPSTPPTPTTEAAKEKNLVAVAPSSGSPTPTTTPTATPPLTASPALVQRGDLWFLDLAEPAREYRLCGLEKLAGFEVLKLTVRLKLGGAESPGGTPFHLDALDLARDAERRRFVERAAQECGLHPDLLKRDLSKLLLAVENWLAERAALDAAKNKTNAAPVVPVMDELLKTKALALLSDPKLLDRILFDFDACGVVGEEINKLVGYLAAVSRLMDRPLAVIIQSSSAAGKTTLMDAILSFMPPEIRIKYSAMTGQSLFYMGGLDLRHKILAIVEEEGAEKASYALKLLQSEGELSIASTGKDPHTGRMEAQEYHVEGPTQLFLTTTAADMDEELQNRAIVLTVDESREQTERIHALQREGRTEAGLSRKARRKQILELHHAAQRLLAPLPVFNPYASRLRFLSNQLRTRRDHEKYLLLIDTITLLFQHQRARKTIPERGECIITTLDDIAVANRLAHHVLGRGLDEMPPQTRRLLGQIQAMEAAREKAGGVAGDWRRRDLRDFTSCGDTQLKMHLQRLVELEYVLMHRDPDHMNGQLYELLFDGNAAANAPHLSGLIDVDQLRREDAAPAQAHTPDPGHAEGDSVNAADDQNAA